VKRLSALLTNLLIGGGCLLTSAAIAMSLSGSSFCSSRGCKVVEDYLSIDPIFMYALGFFFFCLMLIFERRESLTTYGSTLLMFALAAEGYLVGFQLFVVHTVCIFCLTIASIIAGLGLLKLFGETRRIVLNGFLLFALTCSLVGFVNVSFSPIPSGDDDVLIYSKNCPHCEEVIRFSRERGIPLKLCEANEVKGGLKWMGIDVVPVLVCSDTREKKIYTGTKNILAVLAAKYKPSTEEVITPARPSGKVIRHPIKKWAAEKATKMSESSAPDRKDSGSFMEYGQSFFPGRKNDETCSINTNSGKTCE